MAGSLTISEMFALYEGLDVEISGEVLVPFVDETQTFGNQNLAAPLNSVLNFANKSLIVTLTSQNNEITVPNGIGVIVFETTQSLPVNVTINMPSEPVPDGLLSFITDETLNVTFATNLTLIFNGAPPTIGASSPLTFQFIENSGWWKR